MLCLGHGSTIASALTQVGLRTIGHKSSLILRQSIWPPELSIWMPLERVLKPFLA